MSFVVNMKKICPIHKTEMKRTKKSFWKREKAEYYCKECDIQYIYTGVYPEK